MADERYQWLDEDAAERLLSGEPVEPADDRARTDALRLAEALEAARTLPPADGELPGETTVLAAFREAAHTRQRTAAGTRRAAPKGQDSKAGPVSRQDGLQSVRIGGGRPSGGLRARWSRPARYGLVLSLAGCALGGVAVASGAGMLPGPFGGQGSPVPAASVSAAASPEELASGLPSDPGPSSPPGTHPGPRTSDPAPDPTSGTGDGSGHSRHDGDTTEGAGTGESGPDGSGRAQGPRDGTAGDETPAGNGEAGSGEVYEKAVQACRQYREGTLDRATKRRLIEMAKSEDNLDRFCERLDDADDKDGGAEGGGSDSDGPEGSPGSGAGDGGGGETDEGGSGSLPSISFRTPPPSPDDGGDSDGDTGSANGSATTAPDSR